MKGLLLSISFQHHSVSRDTEHIWLLAANYLLTAPREEKISSVHISLFCCLCRLKGRCEGRQKLEALLLQLSQHEQPLLLLFEGGTLILWNLESGSLTAQQKEWAGKDASAVIPECDILCLKLGQHKQGHNQGRVL